MTDTIGLIWAQAHGGVIGAGGRIPWHLPEDLRRFRRLTLGCRVIMGRRTWESLPDAARPLPGRQNVVVTRQHGYEAPGACVEHALEAALSLGGWVIGGAEIYAAALPWADFAAVTEIDVSVPGDAWAPALDGTSFQAHCGPWQESAGGLRHRLLVWRRPRSAPPAQ